MTAHDDADILPGWLTTTEARELTGYNLAYLERLAKWGKVLGRKVGPVWVIDRGSLLEYKATVKMGPKPKS